ncbi:ABC transporter permease [Schleiferilactobacillus shenzhenensis]|uniref:Transport permease protein n=1 Tax=Schleiferilactobacillus shenzhenensis LY-73 TaxID=1231336 RepID=U4TR93_9LACO|nr:ABC transporter permease [Schleiferilactobacillus shenzhenensis]ERL65975.1 hypothetical protein L248_2051 [Schleiferilactobacillus shenzhenensis LY-73]
MSIKQVYAVAKLNTRLQLGDPTVPLILMLVPLVMAPFMLPAAKIQLLAQGYVHVNGSEQVIPGLAVLFSFFSIQLIIQMFFDETTWNTWNRLQVSATSLGDIILGKVVIAYLIQVIQLTVVLLASTWLFRFRITGSWWAFVLVVLTFAAVLTLFGTLLVSWTPSANVAISLSNLLGILMAGLGGSLSPTSTFPAWAKHLARLDPAYWGLSAMHRISLGAAGVSDVRNDLLVLLLIAAAFGILSLAGFRYRPLKEGDD